MNRQDWKEWIQGVLDRFADDLAENLSFAAFFFALGVAVAWALK